MTCARCRAEAPATATVCGHCGTPFPVRPTLDEVDGGVTRLPSSSSAPSLGDEDGGLTMMPAPSFRRENGGATPLPSPPPDDEDGGLTIVPSQSGAREPATRLGTSPGAENRPDGDARTAVTSIPGTQPSQAGSDTGPLTPGQSFGPRYHIIKLLGLGGMGAVYQAWDAELGVVVALKVIRPEAAADDPTAARDLERRFKRELLLARQVTHKNVVRIHDLGEIDGIKYITMPFVEGEDLATHPQARRAAFRRARGRSHRARHRSPAWRPRTRRASSTATSSRRTS